MSESLPTLVLAAAVGLLVPVCTTPAGVSGAVVLLPFQSFALALTGPAVSSTNLLYNVLANPSAVLRFRRTGTLVRPLAVAIVLGSVPGAVIGAVLRVSVLAGAGLFDVLAGLLLAAVGAHLLWRGRRRHARPGAAAPAGPGSRARRRPGRPPAGAVPYRLDGRVCWFHPRSTAGVALAVGCLGGIFGIGGGSLLAPILITRFRQPVRAVAGATLIATFLTSTAALATFELLDALQLGAAAGPRWALGAALGAGGSLGSYLGARLQGRLPEHAVVRVLGVVLALAGVGYLLLAR